MSTNLVYKTPLVPFLAEFRKLCTNADELAEIKIYDSEVGIDEIYEDFQTQSDIDFGVITDVTCTTTHTKIDSIVWDCQVRIEFFSNYNGRLHVAQSLDLLGQTVSSYLEAFSINLSSTGFVVIRFEVGDTTLGTSTTDGSGFTWNNGYSTFHFYICQINNFVPPSEDDIEEEEP